MKIETYFVSLKLLPNATTFNLHLSERDIDNGLWSFCESKYSIKSYSDFKASTPKLHDCNDFLN